MLFQWFVAIRYLRDARGQSALMLAAVAVGVSVIVFLSALINGLQSSLIESTLGSQPHITLRVRREEPRPLVEPREGLAIARHRQTATQRLRSLDQWPAIMRASAMAEVSINFIATPLPSWVILSSGFAPGTS